MPFNRAGDTAECRTRSGAGGRRPGWGVPHLRTQRDLHRVGELLHARKDRRPALSTEFDLLGSIVPDLLVCLRIHWTAQSRNDLFRQAPSVRRRNDMHACVGRWQHGTIAIWTCTQQAHEAVRSWRWSLRESQAHEDEGGTGQCRFAALASALPTLCMASAGPPIDHHVAFCASCAKLQGSKQGLAVVVTKQSRIDSLSWTTWRLQRPLPSAGRTLLLLSLTQQRTARIRTSCTP